MGICLVAFKAANFSGDAEAAMQQHKRISYLRLHGCVSAHAMCFYFCAAKGLASGAAACFWCCCLSHCCLLLPLLFRCAAAGPPSSVTVKYAGMLSFIDVRAN